MGDRVIIYMPMVPAAVIAMLACARIGAIHSVVFGGFAPEELAKRLESQTRLVVTASCGIEVNRVVAYKPLLDQAIDSPPRSPSGASSCSAPWRGALVRGRDLDWEETLSTPAPPTAFPWPPPIPSTVSTPRAPRESPKAWCETTAATR